MSFTDDVDFAIVRIGMFDDHPSFPSYHHWPRVHQQLLIKRHLTQLERLNFLAFLIGNGLNPLDARATVLYPFSNYDASAISHVNDLCTYLPQGRISTIYWDMILQTYVNMKTGEENANPSKISK